MSLTHGTSFKMGISVSPRKDWQNRIGLCGNAYHFGSADWFPAVEPESRPRRAEGAPSFFRGVAKEGGDFESLSREHEPQKVTVQGYALAASTPTREPRICLINALGTHEFTMHFESAR